MAPPDGTEQANPYVLSTLLVPGPPNERIWMPPPVPPLVDSKSRVFPKRSTLKISQLVSWPAGLLTTTSAKLSPVVLVTFSRTTGQTKTMVPLGAEADVGKRKKLGLPQMAPLSAELHPLGEYERNAAWAGAALTTVAAATKANAANDIFSLFIFFPFDCCD
jgi:hypothetical protein